MNYRHTVQSVRQLRAKVVSDTAAAKKGEIPDWVFPKAAERALASMAAWRPAKGKGRAKAAIPTKKHDSR